MPCLSFVATIVGMSLTKHCIRDIWLAMNDLGSLAWPLGSATYLSVLLLTSLYILRGYRKSQKQRTTRIQGPRSSDWVFGFSKILLDSSTASQLYESWASEYGSIYRVPYALGDSRVVLWDPKAISHFFARDTWLYNQTPFNKIGVRLAVCPFTSLCQLKYTSALLRPTDWKRIVVGGWREPQKVGDMLSSRTELNPSYFIRQRKALNPAFSAAAIRSLASIFQDAAHKVSH